MYCLIFDLLSKLEGQIKHKKAFTIVEVLIDFIVISVIGMAVVSAYFAAYKSIDLARMRLVAVGLANEKMEMIRNMPYDDLATQSGSIYPPGEILDNETVDRNGLKFNVKTVITYVDDAFDGNAQGSIAGKPVDVYPYDYKKAEIVVSKLGKNGQLAKLTTNVSAKAAETPSDTGIISLCVIDSASLAVDGATVSIYNTEIVPNVNISVETGEDGCIMIPKLPPDEHNHYNITVTKDGYSTDGTYPRTAQNPNATQPDVNVIVQQVTNVTFAIDRLSTMKINFVDTLGQPVPNVNFTMHGDKEKYFNPSTYKYNENLTTDANGHIELTNMEFDQYTISEVFGDRYLVSTTPMQKINLLADTILEVTAVLSTSSSNPAIFNIFPTKGSRGDIISIKVTGSNIKSNATIRLFKDSGLEITGTNVEITPQIEIIADFDLTNKETGLWHLEIENTNGEKVTQRDIFEVIGN